MAMITNFNHQAGEQQRVLTDLLRAQRLGTIQKYSPANDNRLGPQAANSNGVGNLLSQACASESSQGEFPPGFGLA